MSHENQQQNADNHRNTKQSNYMLRVFRALNTQLPEPPLPALAAFMLLVANYRANAHATTERNAIHYANSSGTGLNLINNTFPNNGTNRVSLQTQPFDFVTTTPAPTNIPAITASRNTAEINNKKTVPKKADTKKTKNQIRVINDFTDFVEAIEKNNVDALSTLVKNKPESICEEVEYSGHPYTKPGQIVKASWLLYAVMNCKHEKTLDLILKNCLPALKIFDEEQYKSLLTFASGHAPFENTQVTLNHYLSLSDLNYPRFFDKTFLDACRNGALNQVKALVKSGNIRIGDNDRTRKAYKLAQDNNHKNIMKFLEEEGYQEKSEEPPQMFFEEKNVPVIPLGINPYSSEAIDANSNLPPKHPDQCHNLLSLPIFKKNSDEKDILFFPRCMQFLTDPDFEKIDQAALDLYEASNKNDETTYLRIMNSWPLEYRYLLQQLFRDRFNGKEPLSKRQKRNFLENLPNEKKSDPNQFPHHRPHQKYDISIEFPNESNEFQYEENLFTVIEKACITGNLSFIKRLEAKNLLIDIDANAFTYFKLALKNKRSNIVDYFIENGLSVKKQRENHGEQEMNLLQSVVQENNLNAATEMLRVWPEGINLQEPYTGKTALHYAVENLGKTREKSKEAKEAEEIINILLNAGANTDITDKTGKKPCDYMDKNKFPGLYSVLNSQVKRSKLKSLIGIANPTFPLLQNPYSKKAGPFKPINPPENPIQQCTYISSKIKPSEDTEIHCLVKLSDDPDENRLDEAASALRKAIESNDPELQAQILNCWPYKIRVLLLEMAKNNNPLTSTQRTAFLDAIPDHLPINQDEIISLHPHFRGIIGTYPSENDQVKQTEATIVKSDNSAKTLWKAFSIEMLNEQFQIGLDWFKKSYTFLDIARLSIIVSAIVFGRKYALQLYKSAELMKKFLGHFFEKKIKTESDGSITLKLLNPANILKKLNKTNSPIDNYLLTKNNIRETLSPYLKKIFGEKNIANENNGISYNIKNAETEFKKQTKVSIKDAISKITKKLNALQTKRQLEKEKIKQETVYTYKSKDDKEDTIPDPLDIDFNRLINNIKEFELKINPPKPEILNNTSINGAYEKILVLNEDQRFIELKNYMLQPVKTEDSIKKFEGLLVELNLSFDKLDKAFHDAIKTAKKPKQKLKTKGNKDKKGKMKKGKEKVPSFFSFTNSDENSADEEEKLTLLKSKYTKLSAEKISFQSEVSAITNFYSEKIDSACKNRTVKYFDGKITLIYSDIQSLRCVDERFKDLTAILTSPDTEKTEEQLEKGKTLLHGLKQTLSDLGRTLDDTIQRFEKTKDKSIISEDKIVREEDTPVGAISITTYKDYKPKEISLQAPAITSPTSAFYNDKPHVFKQPTKKELYEAIRESYANFSEILDNLKLLDLKNLHEQRILRHALLYNLSQYLHALTMLDALVDPETFKSKAQKSPEKILRNILFHIPEFIDSNALVSLAVDITKKTPERIGKFNDDDLEGKFDRLFLLDTDFYKNMKKKWHEERNSPIDINVCIQKISETMKMLHGLIKVVENIKQYQDNKDRMHAIEMMIAIIGEYLRQIRGIPSDPIPENWTPNKEWKELISIAEQIEIGERDGRKIYLSELIHEMIKFRTATHHILSIREESALYPNSYRLAEALETNSDKILALLEPAKTATHHSAISVKVRVPK